MYMRTYAGMYLFIYVSMCLIVLIYTKPLVSAAFFCENGSKGKYQQIILCERPLVTMGFEKMSNVFNVFQEF